MFRIYPPQYYEEKEKLDPIPFGANMEGQKLIAYFNNRERLRERVHRLSVRVILTDEDVTKFYIEKNPKKRD